MTRIRDGVRIKPPKTKRGTRSITIPRPLADMLRKLAASKRTNDFLFIDPMGLPYWLSTVRKRHKKMCKAAGLDFPFRLYDLRHTHATFLLMKRHSPHVVSRRLGHRDVATTLDIYAHALPDMELQATDDLEATILADDVEVEGLVTIDLDAAFDGDENS